MSNSFNTSVPTTDPSAFTMPYGRYAGSTLSDIPTQYLRWLYRDCDFTLFPEMQRAIEQYLGLPTDPIVRQGSQAAQAYARGEAPSTPSRGPVGLKGGSNGGPGRGPQTGLDGFRAAFERTKREILTQFSDDQDLVELMEDVLGRVRKGLGI